jgi:transcriptional regulator with XRE-family HTH domain
MSERDAFGPNLRRLRLQRGVSLRQLAETTKVSESLWSGLERNDFSRWPTGIYARSFVRDYANAIGLDPEATVGDFCRWFPQGDRRAEPVIRGQAEIVGHDKLEWRDRDHVSPKAVAGGDRRGSASTRSAAVPKKGHGPFAALLRRALRRA